MCHISPPHHILSYLIQAYVHASRNSNYYVWKNGQTNPGEIMRPKKHHSPIYKKWQPKDHILWPCYMELYPIIKPASNGFMPLSPMLTTSTMRELLTMSWNVTNLSQKAPPPQCEHHNHHWYCFAAQLSRSYLTPVAYN